MQEAEFQSWRKPARAHCTLVNTVQSKREYCNKQGGIRCASRGAVLATLTHIRCRAECVRVGACVMCGGGSARGRDRRWRPEYNQASDRGSAFAAVGTIGSAIP